MYAKVSSQIALMDNAKLQSLLDKSESQNGWGRAQTIALGQSKVFIKRVPITALEYENAFSTQNLYDLPMYYHYGVGSAGFGVFRELITYIKTTNWVLEGAIANFPLMYHYRILSTYGARAEVDWERHQGYVKYWDSNANIGRYLLDRASAGYEMVLFLEYIPDTVGSWLSENTHQIERLLADIGGAITFLRKNGILHLDAHFHNILTDSERFYLTDFGLALDESFDLTPTEEMFYQKHCDYDYGELLSSLGSHSFHMWPHGLSDAEKRQISERYGIREKMEYEEMLSLLVNHKEAIHADGLLKMDRSYIASIAKYWSVLLLMQEFFFTIQRNDKKDTPFPNVKLRRLLTETGFIPTALPDILS